MEDPDEPVTELTQRAMMAELPGPQRVVIGTSARRGVHRAERPLVARIGQVLVTGVARRHRLPLSRYSGDRGGPGVVLAGLGITVSVRIVAELCEHPGAQHVRRVRDSCGRCQQPGADENCASPPPRARRSARPDARACGLVRRRQSRRRFRSQRVAAAPVPAAHRGCGWPWRCGPRAGMPGRVPR